MAEERAAGREDPRSDRLLPIGSFERRVDLVDDDVDQGVQELVLVGHVPVERHRDDVEGLGELPHAQRLDASLIGQGDRGAEHPFPGQGRTGLGADVDLRAHPLTSRAYRIDKCTPYTYSPAIEVYGVHTKNASMGSRGGDLDEGDRAGSIRLGGRSGVPRHRGARGRRERRPRPRACRRMRSGRLAPDDRDAVHGASRDRAPHAEASRSRLGRRGHGRCRRLERHRYPARRRGHGHHERLVRGARDRQGGRPGPEAGRSQLRGGRSASDLRHHGPPGHPRRGPTCSRVRPSW